MADHDGAEVAANAPERHELLLLELVKAPLEDGQSLMGIRVGRAQVWKVLARGDDAIVLHRGREAARDPADDVGIAAVGPVVNE